MKIHNQELRIYGLALFGILSVLVIIIQFIVLIILWTTHTTFSWMWIIIIDFISIILLFLGIWKYLTKRFFQVVPSASFAYHFNSGPWINWQKDPKTSITINWFTKEPSSSRVEYWIQENEEKVERNGNKCTLIENNDLKNMHHLTINQLEPDTHYSYRILDFSQDPHIHTFCTAPSEPIPFDFMVIGDSQNGGGNQQDNWAYPKLLETMQQYPTDLYHHVGDFVDQGNDINSWHLTLDATSRIAANIPFHVAIGNHDGGSNFLHDDTIKKYPDDGANFDYFFGFQYQNSIDDQQITALKGRYYSFYYSNCIFLFLDNIESSKARSDNEQWNYLRKILTEVPDTYWKIVLMHRPQIILKKSEGNQYSLEYNRFAEYFLPIFEEFGVDLVIQGHGHYFMRNDWILSENTPFYNKIKNPKRKLIRFVTTGGGGNDLRINQPIEYEDAKIEGFKYKENSSQFIRIHIDGDLCKLESRRANNSLMYSEEFIRNN